MSRNQMLIGMRADGGVMTLPADLGDKKIALVAQSKKGKTYGLGVILEELAKAKRPFIATDPANNLWGLRVKPDGSPSGLPVVVIGGPHGDIPLEKDAGERVAEALLTTPQCAVLDLSIESQGTKRRFMTAFAERLMRQRCPFPLPIFLEEAPELIPQRALGPQIAICKAAVSKLATIGGNFGYGVLAATQRPATLDKDVLSQCEALIVMGITHAVDRRTIAEWVEAKDIGERVKSMFAELGSLEPGQAWLWWPSEDRFEKFAFRKRETLHPREMKKLGLEPSGVQLGDAQEFVARLRKDMAKIQVAVPTAQPSRKQIMIADGEKAAAILKSVRHPLADEAVAHANAAAEKLQARVTKLEEELQVERGLRAGAEERVEICRKLLKPQWDTLKRLFEEITVETSASAVDRTIYEPWLAKAGQRGCRKLLEVLLDRRELTRNQLGTLAGVPAGKSTFRNYLSWLRSNGLVETDGDRIRLRAV